MPTYDYKCTVCKHAMEAFHSMKDKPLRKCPKCGKNALERLIGTGAAVLFKGSGFYQTDYRSESYKKAAASEKSGGSSASESSSKSESGKSESGKSDSGSSSGSSTAAAAASPPAAAPKPAGEKPEKKPKKAS